MFSQASPDQLQELIETYGADERSGVAALVRRARKRLEAEHQ